MRSLDEVWLTTLTKLLDEGVNSVTYGKPARELPQLTVTMNLRRPVLTVEERKLSYSLMAAQAYWVLSGDDTVAGIAPWSERAAERSDDGIKLFGACGPSVLNQLDYVVSKLMLDQSTHQAGITFWRTNPPITKDYPRTVAAWFLLHPQKDQTHALNMHVFARSLDVWKELPYSAFSLSMLAHLVAARINLGRSIVVPGALYLTAATSYLRDAYWLPAAQLRDAYVTERALTPIELYKSEEALLETLRRVRSSEPGTPDRWWEIELGEPLGEF